MIQHFQAPSSYSIPWLGVAFVLIAVSSSLNQAALLLDYRVDTHFPEGSLSGRNMRAHVKNPAREERRDEEEGEKIPSACHLPHGWRLRALG